MVLDKTWIKPVNPKLTPPWKLIGRTDAETQMLWPHDVKSWLIGKYPNVGKGWGQRRRRGQHKMRWWDGINNSMNINLGKIPEMVRDRESSYAPFHEVTNDTTWWLNSNNSKIILYFYTWDFAFIFEYLFWQGKIPIQYLALIILEHLLMKQIQTMQWNIQWIRWGCGDSGIYSGQYTVELAATVENIEWR